MTAKRSRKRVASVREYIASKPKESRASLEAVRRAILKALPNAQEGLAYQMPAYTLNGVGVLYFAGWKSHYSLYPASDALVEAFAKELAPYERSKGTLKFPLSEPVPVRLIERIAKFRARQLTTRDGATGRRKARTEMSPGKNYGPSDGAEPRWRAAGPRQDSVEMPSTPPTIGVPAEDAPRERRIA